MRYIKLFEQFDDDDPFGEEIHGRQDLSWKIIKLLSSGNYYIIEQDNNGDMIFLKDCEYGKLWNNYDMNPVIDDETYINIKDSNNVYQDNENFTSIKIPPWVKCKYKDLPQEIKEKLR